MPNVYYYLYSLKQPVEEDDRNWQKPLPLDRALCSGSKDRLGSAHVCHGDYFLAAHSFLADNRYGVVASASGVRLGREVFAEEIDEIGICLVKHGSFYHPARVDVRLKGHHLSFVLNVAVSDAGKKYLKTEYDLLKRLNREFPESYLPAVYGRGTTKEKKKNREFSMFIGKWFDGFYEFHQSFDPIDNCGKLVVWDDIKGSFFLTPAQAEALYRRVAGILTYYYNPQNFSQISSWHHAAGDFIVRMQGSNIEARLVSVRQYRSPFGSQPPDDAMTLNALLIFLLNLSIRTRLDRQDGTGDIVWSDDVAVSGTVKGFLEALKAKEFKSLDGPSFTNGFKAYLSTLSERNLLSLLNHIAGKYPSRQPDVAVVRKHLKAHAARLYQVFSIECNQ